MLKGQPRRGYGIIHFDLQSSLYSAVTGTTDMLLGSPLGNMGYGPSWGRGAT